MKAIFFDVDGPLLITTACADAEDLTAETAIFAFKMVGCMSDPFERGMIKDIGMGRIQEAYNLKLSDIRQTNHYHTNSSLSVVVCQTGLMNTTYFLSFNEIGNQGIISADYVLKSLLIIGHILYFFTGYTRFLCGCDYGRSDYRQQSAVKWFRQDVIFAK